jgi:hypothetical protein
LIMPKAVKSDVVVDPAPVVQLVDEAGNPRGRAGIPVTIVVDRPDVVVVGGEARTDADGRAVFDGLEFSGAAAPMSVLFSPQGFGSVASDVDLQAGPAAAVSLLTAPTTVMAGASWDPQPIVALIDEAGNVVSGPGTTIEARIAGGETLETVQIDKNGYATFKLTAGPVAGTYDFEFVTRGGQAAGHRHRFADRNDERRADCRDRGSQGDGSVWESRQDAGFDDRIVGGAEHRRR